MYIAEQHLQKPSFNDDSSSYAKVIFVWMRIVLMIRLVFRRFSKDAGLRKRRKADGVDRLRS